MDVVLRPAGPADLEHVKWALFQAVAWNSERQLPPFEVTIEHPELARYHRGWGRPGDLGVVASEGAQVVGVAACRDARARGRGRGRRGPIAEQVSGRA